MSIRKNNYLAIILPRIQGPILIYYYIENFHQNHRGYEDDRLVLSQTFFVVEQFCQFLKIGNFISLHSETTSNLLVKPSKAPTVLTILEMFNRVGLPPTPCSLTRSLLSEMNLKIIKSQEGRER